MKYLKMIPVMVLVSIFLNNCLVPPPNNVLLINGSSSYDAPDPAGVLIYPKVAEIFATDSVINGVSYKIPSYFVNTTSYSTLGLHDSLPNGISWSSGNYWAPAVRYVGGRFLMMVSVSVAGRANCVAAATSQYGETFSQASFQLCDPNPAVGVLDPSIFVNSGQVWLLYSLQSSPGGGSEIDIQQLSSDGLSAVGPPYLLVNYNQLSYLVSQPGPNSFIENPSMTPDDYNLFDLTVSIGSWNTQGYETVEVPCLSVNSNCIASCGGEIMPLLNGDSTSWGPGGASVITDNSPANNFMVWHNGPPNNRVDEFGTTSEYDPSNSTCATTSSGSSLSASKIIKSNPQPATTLNPTVPYHWLPRVPNWPASSVQIGK